jgi:hypothetical protein
MKFITALSLVASTAAFTSSPAGQAPATRLAESKVSLWRRLRSQM